MHAVYKDPDCTRASEMSELNAMDFVETEYKSDEPEDTAVQNKPRRKSQRKPKVTVHYVYEQLDSVVNSSLSPRNTRKYLKKRRKKGFAKSTFENDQDSDERGTFYPYATLLKSLCNEVGRIGSADEPGTEKLFKQLDHANLCYPYATLLQELHEAAREGQSKSPSRIEDDFNNPSEIGVSQIMKSFNYKTSRLLENKADHYEDSEQNDFEMPYSTLLLDMIMDHKLQDHSNVDGMTIYGIGKILKTCMAKLSGGRPEKELHSSALLQKLSLLVQKENTNGDDNEARNQVYGESSAESSLEEEREWRPSNWRTDSTPEVVENDERKRKSQRKKKTITKFDATPEKYKSLGSRNKLRKKSNCKSQSLLQLILGNGGDTFSTHESQSRSKDSKVRSEVLEKIKDKINNRKVLNGVDRRNSMHSDMQRVEDFFRSEECLSETSGEDQSIEHNERIAMAARERRSLLKEYLLKPSDEEVTSKGDCDIPTISGNSFLFSRLLQNFKAASDTRSSCDSLGGLEESTGSSILREMLIETCKPFPSRNTSDDMEDVKHFKPMEHINLSSLQTFLSERNCLDDKNSFCAIKKEVEHEDDVVSSNVLREMLIKARSDSELYPGSDDETEDIKDITITEHLQLSSLENCSSENDSTDTMNPVCEIKCEVKCEDEYIDDTHECNVCYLQFSSRIDLANHELLFHCSEETQTQTPGPTCILPNGSDIIQNGLFQEKLPV